MVIKLENKTISYIQFLKLFAVGWVFGIGSIFVIFGILGFVACAVVGEWAQAAQALALVFLVPIILLLQSFMFASVAYFGIALFRRYRALEFSHGNSI